MRAFQTRAAARGCSSAIVCVPRERSCRGCRRMGRVVRPRAAAATDTPRTQDTTAKRSAADRVRLGSSDLEVSVCCLGTMTWGKQNSEAEAHEQLDYAWGQGINFLDTAEMYPVPPRSDSQGKTDLYIGSWLQHQKRAEVVLATKVSGYSEGSTYVRKPPRTTRVSRDQIKESVDSSLKRLKTDYIDLLQIHWPDRYVPLFGNASYDASMERSDDISFEEQLRGLEEVINAGKVRYIGVSNETSYGVSEFCLAAEKCGLPKIQTIQNTHNLLVRIPFETNLAEMCHRHNVSLLAYSPLAGGALSGKYVKHSDAKGRFNVWTGYMARYNNYMAREAVGEYIRIAEKYGMTPAQMALAWSASRWFTTSTIIGATTLEQLKEDLSGFSVGALPEECLEEIDQVYKMYKDPSAI